MVTTSGNVFVIREFQNQNLSGPLGFFFSRINSTRCGFVDCWRINFSSAIQSLIGLVFVMVGFRIGGHYVIGIKNFSNSSSSRSSQWACA